MLGLLDLNETVNHSKIEKTCTDPLIAEMRMFRAEMSATRAEMGLLNANIAKLTARIDACETRIDQVEGRMNALECQLKKNPARNTDDSLLATVEQLKQEIGERDQALLSNDIEISCIPEEKGENIQHIITTVVSKLGVSLAEQDIVSAERVGRTPDASSPARPRLIVVRLARRAVRDQVLKAARVRRGATTEDTGLPAPHRRFYVNERLTRANRHVFRHAREAAGRMHWRYVWSKDGKIYARKHQDGPRHRLRSENDVFRVFGLDIVGSSNNESN
ncbi:hypothetical protein O0L34_g6383 [Tuta absoluta]|nr:hypothetical protein O0L34_g6383 [Tuta absoluta]